MKILYFGIHDPGFGRNRVYMKGLRERGVEVVECRDTSSGLLKYWRLWNRHRTAGSYDAMIVGYPGHLVVPLAKLISRAPVVADLLGSLEDAEVHSRTPGFLRRMKSRIVDWLAVRCADIVLLESEAQKSFFERRFGALEKYAVLYTGADDAIFHCDMPAWQDTFRVLFRGRLTPESGIVTILEAARQLKAKGSTISFRIIGFGQLLPQVESIIARDALTNVELIAQPLSERELREQMCGATLSLGQFEDNPRLSRTIPHKAYESLAMGIPYLSGDAPAIREIIIDGKNGFLIPLADPNALAEKIHSLSEDKGELEQVGRAARAAFEEHFSPRKLGARLLGILIRSHE